LGGTPPGREFCGGVAGREFCGGVGGRWLGELGVEERMLGVIGWSLKEGAGGEEAAGLGGEGALEDEGGIDIKKKGDK
jgi:hypothetical protein